MYIVCAYFLNSPKHQWALSVNRSQCRVWLVTNRNFLLSLINERCNPALINRTGPAPRPCPSITRLLCRIPFFILEGGVEYKLEIQYRAYIYIPRRRVPFSSWDLMSFIFTFAHPRNLQPWARFPILTTTLRYCTSPYFLVLS